MLMTLHKYVDEHGNELGGGITYLGEFATLTLDTTVAGHLGNPEGITVDVTPA